MEDSQKNIDQYPNADFEYKKLSIKLNKITKDSVYGYSVVNGNQRKFRGVFNENSSKFIFQVCRQALSKKHICPNLGKPYP